VQFSQGALLGPGARFFFARVRPQYTDVLQEPSEVEVFRASLLNGADCKINARVNPLNVTDLLFRRTDITGASDAAVFAELAGNVADGIFAVGLGHSSHWSNRGRGVAVIARILLSALRKQVIGRLRIPNHSPLRYLKRSTAQSECRMRMSSATS
jgi:hypothetical protein